MSPTCVYNGGNCCFDVWPPRNHKPYRPLLLRLARLALIILALLLLLLKLRLLRSSSFPVVLPPGPKTPKQQNVLLFVVVISSMISRTFTLLFPLLLGGRLALLGLGLVLIFVYLSTPMS